MAYKARHVANSLIYKAKNEGSQLTHMKLQKLLFFLNGWNLAVYGRELFDESFEAWPYGPVIENIYHEFKGYGKSPISYAPEPSDENTHRALMVRFSDSDFWKLLDVVWGKYSPYSALQLSDMTHQPDTPWFDARRNGKTFIKNEEIKKYFVEKANDNRNKTHKA
ncbi:type II toxin-antitoxin system antitoxin SocA domain-containing protein [Craterilacuibacter sp. RT1T]|uniref:Panacea domain-containing protein n=1 Tax=Craterilacuibacter sp. RT1T TaxID=2942211 RepID=UPI0020BFAFFF|nr:type II toxin-antitoxin system antitoxin SocA domain-containing protein [Craterilacuibacter sp. RT1T]MCL6264380.1 DUF4065 domain-containing protein [Craterilacuibacter sp. RT1T]